MNVQILAGQLGKDAEIKNFESGKSVINFSIATNSYGKNEQGEKVQYTEWHDCTLWNRDNLLSKLVKGASVAITGKQQSRTWDKQVGSETVKMTKVFTNVDEIRIF